MEKEIITLESFTASLSYAENLIKDINASPYCILSDNLHILEYYKDSLVTDYETLKIKKIDTKSVDTRYGEVLDSINYYINVINAGC